MSSLINERTPSMVLSADRTSRIMRIKRITPKRRFRALVRFVIANLPWLLEDSEVHFGTKVYNLKKSMKSALSREHKFLLHKSPEERTPDERKEILRVMGSIKSFRKYPDDILALLAKHCRFAYFGPNRVIIREGQHAKAIFYMVSGELNIIEERYDKFLDEMERIVVAPVPTGEAFGEISLLHDLPRLRTMCSSTPVEFLVLWHADFDICLKETVKEQWDLISTHMLSFEYFKNWNKMRLSQCCMAAVIRWYKKNETVLGDGFGRNNYVHFVLRGQCVLIEHFQVQPHELPSGKCDFTRAPQDLFFMDFSEAHSGVERVSLGRRSKSRVAIDSEKVGVSNYKLSVEIPRSSIQKQILNMNWTDYSRQLSQRNIQTVFMQVCKFGPKSCFCLGESMKSRRIIAEDDLIILLIPSYMLLGREPIWSRIKQFLIKTIPSSDMIFERFLQQREYQRYKNDTVKPLLNRYCTNWYSNIPYSTRVRSDFEFRTTK